MEVKLDKYDPSNDARTERVAQGMCHVALDAYSKLVDSYPGIGVSVQAVEGRFGGDEAAHAPAADAFVRQLQGTVTGATGERPAQTYLAATGKTGETVVGWLTTALDYSNQLSHRVNKSYLWLVNFAVHPEYQRKGVMSGLFQIALRDPKQPNVLSLRRHVVSYPNIVAPGTPSVILPGQRLLLNNGLRPSPAAAYIKEENGLFGPGVVHYLQPHEGGSPRSTANLVEKRHKRS